MKSKIIMVTVLAAVLVTAVSCAADMNDLRLYGDDQTYHKSYATCHFEDVRPGTTLLNLATDEVVLADFDRCGFRISHPFRNTTSIRIHGSRADFHTDYSSPVTNYRIYFTNIVVKDDTDCILLCGECAELASFDLRFEVVYDR